MDQEHSSVSKWPNWSPLSIHLITLSVQSTLQDAAQAKPKVDGERVGFER